jgi:hypothetical protein
MLSLPAIIWASLENYEKSDKEEKTSIEELVQEAVLHSIGVLDPFMGPRILGVGVHYMKKNKQKA